MSGTHFYLTLPSNASLDVFPDNKTSSYRVKLPQTIDLNGNWEVGLYSVSYPNTWYTIKNYENHILYSLDGVWYTSTTNPMDYGYYETMEDFIKAFNIALKTEPDVKENIKLSFNARTGKVTVTIKNGRYLYLDGLLSIILGFGGKVVKLDTTTESPYVADLRGMTTIYIYCNIVQPQIVGDTSAQLLRSIPVEGKSGDIVTKTFTNIQYVPVQTKSFEDVEILLRSDTGDPVSFERGKVVTTLHFRKHTYFT